MAQEGGACCDNSKTHPFVPLCYHVCESQVPRKCQARSKPAQAGAPDHDSTLPRALPAKRMESPGFSETNECQLATIAHWRPKQAIACKPPPGWPTSNLAFVANSLHVLFLLSGASFLLVSNPSTEYRVHMCTHQSGSYIAMQLWPLASLLVSGYPPLRQSRRMVLIQNGVMQWPQLWGGFWNGAPRCCASHAAPSWPRSSMSHWPRSRCLRMRQMPTKSIHVLQASELMMRKTASSNTPSTGGTRIHFVVWGAVFWQASALSYIPAQPAQNPPGLRGIAMPQWMIRRPRGPPDCRECPELCALFRDGGDGLTEDTRPAHVLKSWPLQLHQSPPDLLSSSEPGRH